MLGKICVVTGASSGLGRVTALELARMGATVVLLGGRDPARLDETRQAIVAQTGNAQVEALPADFASLASVRQAAGAFLARHQALHVLVNNAGLYTGKRQLSADGFELTFAVNHLATFLLTALLLGALRAAAPARVVTVSSVAHLGGATRFDDLRAERGYNGWRVYADSKLANVLFTYELARRLGGSGVTATCLHPGAVATNFASEVNGLFSFFFSLARPFLLTPEQGAQTSIYLAASPEVEGVTARYFVNRRAQTSGPASYDRAAQSRLWQLSEELVGLPTPAVV